MRYGLFGINIGRPAAEPAAALELAATAERAGWESVWTGEHFVLPDPATPQSPVPPDTPMLDAFTCLGAIAARTTRLLLGTGVTIVPYHHPVALAKRVASLDRLSAGRVLFGVGAGYLEEEFAALDVPLAERGRRTDEALEAIGSLWADDTAETSFLGRPIAGVRAEPRPVCAGGPPLIVGGHSRAAYRRALRFGRGWYGWQLTPAATREALADIADERRRLQDDPAVVPPLFEIMVTPPRSLDVTDDVVAEYADAGVDRLAVRFPPELRSLDSMAAFLDDPGWSIT